LTFTMQMAKPTAQHQSSKSRFDSRI